jgi:hypothetical protein
MGTDILGDCVTSIFRAESLLSCPVDEGGIRTRNVGTYLPVSGPYYGELCLKGLSKLHKKSFRTCGVPAQCCVRCRPDEERILDVVRREDGVRNSGQDGE